MHCRPGREGTNIEEHEAGLLLKAIHSTNLPKFVTEDIPLFEQILADVFPGLAKPGHGDKIFQVSTSVDTLVLNFTGFYICHILQHFALKLCNFTNFGMLFQHRCNKLYHFDFFKNFVLGPLYCRHKMLEENAVDEICFLPTGRCRGTPPISLETPRQEGVGEHSPFLSMESHISSGSA